MGPSKLADGESVQVKGSGSSLYTLKNSGGVLSCTCPAWRNQDLGIERRTCKHLRAYLGDEAESARLGAAALTGRPPKPPRAAGPGDGAGSAEDDEDGPPLLLAQKWSTDTDLTGWWLSEKLDGVRAYWDGTQFISRLGNRFFAPKWFTERLPAMPLDGELWGGRKLFQRTVGIVKRQDESDLWKELVYMVFDAPAHEGVFEERMAHVESTVQALDIAWLRAHTHTRCEGTEQLRDELARVEALGGEGLMLRQPGSRYEAGRSNTLVKVKSFHDAEARVLAHVPGMGRHKGRLGALLVELEDGTQFNVGTGFSDAQRDQPPAVGAIITFRYQELSNTGVPRFPTFVGERIDGRFHSTATPGSKVRRVTSDTASSIRTSTSPPARSPSMSTRRFEMTDDDETRYFWEIELDGSKQKVRFGTVEERKKLFETDEEAQENTLKKIADQLAKGFVEVTSLGAATVTPPAVVAAVEAPRAAVAAAAAAAVAAAVPAPERAPVAPAASSKTGEEGVRYLEFVEGGSAKFWEIRVEGCSFVTRYGKIGTEGQMTQKDFPSEAKAKAEADKLLAEKTKKGYVEK